MATQIQTTVGEILAACDRAMEAYEERREADLRRREELYEVWRRSSWLVRTFGWDNPMDDDTFETFDGTDRVVRYLRKSFEGFEPSRIVMLDEWYVQAIDLGRFVGHET